MKKAAVLTSFVVVAFGLLGCASTIPMSANLNDFVMFGIETNNAVTIMYDFSSQVTDGETKFYTKDKEKIDNGHTAAIITESATLKRMLANYMGAKFTTIVPNGSISIKIILQDFWLETYTENMAQALLFGVNNLNTMYTANIKVLVVITKDGQEHTKVLQTSSDDVQSGQSIGQNSWENVVGRVINDTNNKVLMLLNAYFEELQL
jgi:hypothetical protein